MNKSLEELIVEEVLETGCLLPDSLAGKSIELLKRIAKAADDWEREGGNDYIEDVGGAWKNEEKLQLAVIEWRNLNQDDSLQ